MLPSSHQARWTGENRLWLEHPAEPERSDALLDAAGMSVAYRWSFRGKPQQGKIELSGPPGSLRADWTDSWHAPDAMVLHGRMDDGLLLLYGTYPAGEGPAWGWKIELDMRDPEHFVLRMFNLDPDGSIAPAVDLRGGRSSD
jgi:hypothetical protein